MLASFSPTAVVTSEILSQCWRLLNILHQKPVQDSFVSFLERLATGKDKNLDQQLIKHIQRLILEEGEEKTTAAALINDIENDGAQIKALILAEHDTEIVTIELVNTFIVTTFSPKEGSSASRPSSSPRSAFFFGHGPRAPFETQATQNRFNHFRNRHTATDTEDEKASSVDLYHMYLTTINDNKVPDLKADDREKKAERALEELQPLLEKRGQDTVRLKTINRTLNKPSADKEEKMETKGKFLQRKEPSPSQDPDSAPAPKRRRLG